MKIAIPVTGGRLSAHFGHCEQFSIFDVDSDGKKITGQQSRRPMNRESCLNGSRDYRSIW